tara:strand:- start:265 stop:675 length:411 start_codon:yes stop_codon:yes gene_type:complete
MLYLNNLPEDVLNNIFLFIDNNEKIFLNKYYYFKFHKLVVKKMDSKIFECYLRDIIRADYSFVFQEILKEKLNFWLIYNKCVRFEKFLFTNYFQYIKYLINKYNSGKIKDKIMCHVKKSNKLKEKIININNNKWLH